MWADNRLFKIGTHGRLVDSDLSHFAVEFRSALLAPEIDLHFILSILRQLSGVPCDLAFPPI